MQMNRLDKTEQVLCCVIGHDTLWGAVAEWRAVLGSDPRQRGTVCVCAGITAPVYCAQDTLRTHGSTVGVL